MEVERISCHQGHTHGLEEKRITLYKPQSYILFPMLEASGSKVGDDGSRCYLFGKMLQQYLGRGIHAIVVLGIEALS